MQDLYSLIASLSDEGFLPEFHSDLSKYIESTEKDAVIAVSKQRVLTIGQEARIGIYLRTKALDEELSFFETGVALLSIGIALEEQIEGESSEIITENMRQKGCRTIGEFLFITGPAGERIVKHSNLTGYYKIEFNKIWKKQISYRPLKYTDDLKNRIYGDLFE